jgi:hypothetical protein
MAAAVDTTSATIRDLRYLRSNSTDIQYFAYYQWVFKLYSGKKLFMNNVPQAEV